MMNLNGNDKLVWMDNNGNRKNFDIFIPTP